MMRIVEVDRMVYLTSGILSMTCILCAQVTGKLIQGCIAIVRLTTCAARHLYSLCLVLLPGPTAWSYCLVLLPGPMCTVDKLVLAVFSSRADGPQFSGRRGTTNIISQQPHCPQPAESHHSAG